MREVTLLLFLVLCSLYFVKPASSFTNFTCNNGDQISISQFCDGQQDCDGSDELMTSSSCSDCNQSQVRCTIANRTCLIDINFICNATVQCEQTDLQGNSSVLSPCHFGCATHYRCQNGDCELRSTICDDLKNGCRDDEDEFEGGIGFKCFRDRRNCRIPQQLLWDDVEDCEKGEDLCYSTSNLTSLSTGTTGRDIRNLPSTTFSQSRCFMCLNGPVIIPRRKVCDGVIDCPDLSDECLCEGSSPEICEHVVQKASSRTYNRDSAQCDVGEVQCHDGSCISRNSVCDSINNCPDAMDEKFSYCRGTLLCRGSPKEREGELCRCDNNRQYNMATLCNGQSECPGVFFGAFNVDPVDECLDWCNSTNNSSIDCDPSDNFFLALPKKLTVPCKEDLNSTSEETKIIEYKEICDGIPHCEISQKDESEDACPEQRIHCTAGNKVNIPNTQKCDGIVHCDNGMDETRDVCPYRFFCTIPTSQKVSINNNSRCDFHASCDDQSDEINCNDTRFYCETGNPLYVNREKVFDGKQDCSDGSDECPMNDRLHKTDVLSSPYHLIDNVVLRILVWIMAILALTGNLIVIRVELGNIRNIFRKKSQPASLKTYHILIMNLAIADLLMGIYLLSLGIAGAVFHGVYCLNHVDWLASSACEALGALVVISSEASIITIVILSSCRMFAVFKPFAASTKPTTKAIIIFVIMAWFFPCLFAFIPLAASLEYIFADTVILQNSSFFENPFVELSSAKAFGEKILTFDPQMASSTPDTLYLIRNSKSWSELQSALENSTFAELLKPFRHFGYYSSNSVCIPQLFVTRDDQVWQYSLFLSIFNFLAFMYVACAYIVILRKLRSSSKKNTYEATRDREIDAMQRKIYRLIASDFCSWVPISIMAFINFAGVSLPTVAYAISAIVLLPINSALNPILYFDILGPIIARIKKASSKNTRPLNKLRQSFTVSASTHIAATSNFTATANSRL